MTDTTASPSTTAPLTWEEVVAGCKEVATSRPTCPPSARRPAPRRLGIARLHGREDLVRHVPQLAEGREPAHLARGRVGLAREPRAPRVRPGDATAGRRRPESDELWDAGILSYDPALFFGTKDNPELLFVELTPTRIAIGSLIAPDDPPRVDTEPLTTRS